MTGICKIKAKHLYALVELFTETSWVTSRRFSHISIIRDWCVKR